MSRLKWIGFGLPALFLLAVEAFRFFVLDQVLPPGSSHMVAFALVVVAILLFSRGFLGVIGRLQENERQAHQRVLANNRQLEAMHDAALSIAADLSLDTVLLKVVDLSRQVIGARYGALAVLDDQERIGEFIVSGISPEERAKLGDPPRGEGVLGLVIRERKAIRLSKLSEHPNSVGYPPGHPPMESFLGVPIIFQERVLGNLYLTEKNDGGEFTEYDQKTLERFATWGAIAIENARLYARVEQVGALEERERISMDLHDGTIQSLYALGLSLEEVLERVESGPAGLPEAEARLDRSIDRLGQIIADIRHYIFDKRSEPVAGSSFKEQVEQLIQVLELRQQFNVHLDLPEAGVPVGLSTDQRAALLQIAREGLTNVIKHSRATRLEIKLESQPEQLIFFIVDNGVGFDPAQKQGPEHHGLRNIQSRVARLGGGLQIRSAHGEGTCIKITLPISSDTVEEE